MTAEIFTDKSGLQREILIIMDQELDGSSKNRVNIFLLDRIQDVLYSTKGLIPNYSPEKKRKAKPSVAVSDSTAPITTRGVFNERSFEIHEGPPPTTYPVKIRQTDIDE